MKWIFLLVFGAVGLSGTIGGAIWGYHRLDLWQHGTTTHGKVFKMEESTSESTDSDGHSRTSTVWCPWVEFETAGKAFKFRGSTGSSPASHQEGDDVEVLYMAENPKVAQIKSFEQFWLGPIGVFVFGFIFFCAGVFAFFFIRKSDQTFAGVSNNAFFAMNRKNLGRFKKVGARITNLRVESSGTGEKRFSFEVEEKDPVGEPLRFVTNPGTFKLNGWQLTEEVAQSLVGEDVTVTYDPLNQSDFSADIFALMRRRAA